MRYCKLATVIYGVGTEKGLARFDGAHFKVFDSWNTQELHSDPNRVPHAELIARLDEAGKTFRVLIFKTDLAIPYTTVFFELDCGYWGPPLEADLRQAMQRGRSNAAPESAGGVSP